MNKVISADGTPIAYERAGEGSPVAIMVGGAFSTRASTAGVGAPLAQHFTVINYDRRGRGDSGDTQPYAVEREVEDLAALIDEIGGEPALFGLSSGGALALRAAAAGLPVSRLALFETPYLPDEEASRKDAQRYTETLKGLLAEGRRADAVIEFLTTIGTPAEMIGQIRQAPMFPALEAVAHTLAYEAEVLGTANGSPIPVDLITSVAVPSLVIYGEASPERMKSIARRLSELLPNASLAGLPEQTHNVAPEAIGPVVVEFLAA